MKQLLKRFIPILGLNSWYMKLKIKILKKLYAPKLCNDRWMSWYLEKQINIDNHQIDLALSSKAAEDMIKNKVEENRNLIKKRANEHSGRRCMVTVDLKQSKT